MDFILLLLLLGCSITITSLLYYCIEDVFETDLDIFITNR